MNTDLNIACRQFVGVVDGEVVSHIGLIPMPMRKDAKRVHRFVVLPDYQGIGIGMSFQSAVCDIVRREGFEGTIWNVTTTPALYKAQIKSDRWKLVRYGHATVPQSGVKKDLMSRMVRNSSRGRITYSFIYVGEEGKERLK